MRESLSVDCGGGPRCTRRCGCYVYFLVFILMSGCSVYFMLCVGTFLVNYVPALVLFDSGASRSFVSLAFSQHISISRETLSRPLRVSIADERVIYATEVIRGCVFEIFGVEFPTDLVPIAMGDVCVIVGMDWLSRFGTVIDCEAEVS